MLSDINRYSNFELEWLNQESNNTKKDDKKGVNLVGCCRREIGVGEACRSTAKALDANNVSFGIKNYKYLGNDLSWIHKEIDEPVYDVNIFHINADLIPKAYQQLGRSFWEGRYNIGCWYWELPDFPKEWINAFKYVDEVWAATEFIINSIKAKSTVPVIYIPPCIKVDCISKISRKDFSLPNNSFLFLTMYDSWSYKARKNPEGAIEAFKACFKPNDMSVGLVIKINNVNWSPSEVNKLISSVEEYNNIYFIKKTLSRSEVNALINLSDCFISLHRSEGFGLVMAEAMYLGVPVIGTNWSGNTDFMDYQNSCPVNYKLVNIGKNYGPYKSYQTWAEPDKEHGGYYMKKLISDKNYYNEIAKNGKRTIRSLYNTERIGKMIKARLEKIKLL